MRGEAVGVGDGERAACPIMGADPGLVAEGITDEGAVALCVVLVDGDV